MPLKIRRWTGAGGQDGLEMVQRLPQGIRRAAGRGGLFPEKTGAQRIQPPVQSAPKPVNGFQRKGQPQLFRGRLEGKSRQPLNQTLPEQPRGEGVSRQNPGQEQGKAPATTALLSAVGTEHPLASERLSVRRAGIIAQQPAVPVQCSYAAAMRTGRLLEGKSWTCNSCWSPTK